MSRIVYETGCYEPNEMAFAAGFLRHGMVFIDVGANLGLFTLLATRRVGSTGTVIAVEPSPREVEDLCANIALNRIDNVTVAAAALGEATGVATLQVAEDEHSGHNTLGSFIYGTKLLARRDVDVTTLDDLARQSHLTRLDFVKIDVEGAELSVLRGGRSALQDFRPVLLMELQADSLKTQGASTAQVLALLSKAGYEVFSFDAATGTLSASQGPGSSTNIVSVPAERRADLGALGLLPRLES